MGVKGRKNARGSIKCPACQKPMAPRSIHKHTSECEAWAERYGEPVPYFKYDPFIKRRKPLYEEGSVEGVDYVQCKVCAGYGWDFRFSRMVQHVKAHNLTVAQYQERYPGAAVRLSKTKERREATNTAKFGTANPFQSNEVKERIKRTNLARYGTEWAGASDEVKAKRRATNLKRYGHQNPFGSDQIKEKIRQTNIDRYGVASPLQNPEIMAQVQATNRERYGANHYLLTEEGKEKARQTSRRNWGTDHPMQSEEVKERLRSVCREVYGVDSPFEHPEIQKKAYESNLRNHEGRHSQQCPEIREKAKETWMSTLGVDNPSKSPEVWEKIKSTWEEKYGQPFPPQCQSFPAPNKLEQRVDNATSPNLVYTGDGSYWIQCGSRNRNPDFVILNDEQRQRFLAGEDINLLRSSCVVEVFGDYWHGPKVTGMSKEAHFEDVSSDYGQAGIQCLILWEGEINSDFEGSVQRIEEFVQLYLGRYGEG